MKGNDDDNGVSKTTLQIEAAVARRCFQPVRHETRREEKRREDKRRGREGKRKDEKRREEKTREERQKGEDNSEVVREILPGLIRPGSNTSYNIHFDRPTDRPTDRSTARPRDRSTRPTRLARGRPCQRADPTDAPHRSIYCCILFNPHDAHG